MLYLGTECLVDTDLIVLPNRILLPVNIIHWFDCNATQNIILYINMFNNGSSNVINAAYCSVKCLFYCIILFLLVFMGCDTIAVLKVSVIWASAYRYAIFTCDN